MEVITEQKPIENEEVILYQLPIIMDDVGRILIPAPVRRKLEVSSLTNLSLKVVDKQGKKEMIIFAS